ncbi:ADP-ribose pyrophosphatase YjhB (NUDIX family) [Kineosphaera limosa]|nr:NUDIX hydrolase [Kineosphaera limosa]NYE00115.1 ADP-ribose pyrophosphatase YjhB (NUDIX family) [Kineosphaera limosa]
MPWTLPTVPASAGALVFDEQGRLLVLKPTYKSGWTVPGGVMEADGESPWDACRREVFEETGLRVTRGRLACVDTRPAKKDRQLGLRFLFDCGAVDAGAIARIRLQREEISDYRFVPPARALTLLRPAVRRRVAAAVDSEHCVYLENGRRVRGLR